MKYQGVCIAVENVKDARAFYEALFGLEVFQDYGINIVFHGGLTLQQEFDWLLSVPKDKVLKASHNMELYFEEDDIPGGGANLVYHTALYLGLGGMRCGWHPRNQTGHPPMQSVYPSPLGSSSQSVRSASISLSL